VGIDDGEISEDGNEDFISDDEVEEVESNPASSSDKGSSYHPSDLEDSFD
jgi:hypothetical protein